MKFIKNKTVFCLIATFFFSSLLKAEIFEESNEIQTMLSKMTFTEKASQVLMINIDGSKSFPAHAYTELDGIIPGAVIFFKYNLADSPEKVRDFTDSCLTAFNKIAAEKNIYSIPPFFALDNEGGSVFRTKGLTSFMPAAAKIPQVMTENEMEAFCALVAAQMKMLGINFNLAPVAETEMPQNKSVLKARTFSAGTKTAALYSEAFIRGMNQNGIFCALKHFPGNGAADMHKESSEIRGNLFSFRKQYLSVFKEILKNENLNTAVLVSHVKVKCIDGVPFCLSKKGITEILRGEVNFKGLILTDDIAMQALKYGNRTSEDNAVDALSAGCDMVMTSERNIKKLVKAISDKAASDKNFACRLNDAAANVLRAKHKMKLIGKQAALPAPFDIKIFMKLKEKAEKYPAAK